MQIIFVLVLAVVTTVTADYLYFSHDDGHIAMRDLISPKSNRTGMKEVYTGTGVIADLVVKMDDELIYWTDESNRSIMRAKADGSDISTLLSEDGYPYGLAINSKKNHIYWSCRENNAVFRASLDAVSSTKQRVASIAQPLGLELDLAKQLLYIAGHDEGVVYQFSIIDDQVSELITGLVEPRMLSASSDQSNLYVTEGSGMVKRINFNAVKTMATTVIDFITSPSGILVADGYVYVSDDLANLIYRFSEMALPMTATVDSIMIKSATPRALALYSEDISPEVSPSFDENNELLSFLPSFRTVSFSIGIASVTIGCVIAFVGIGKAIQLQRNRQYDAIV